MPAYQHLRVSQEGDVTIVRLADREVRGEAAANALQRELDQFAQQNRRMRVVLDLAGVECLTSSAIVQLIMFKRTLETGGVRLVLCGVRPEVLDVFSVMKLDTMFEMEPDRPAAITAFTRPVPPPPPLETDEERVASGEG